MARMKAETYPHSVLWNSNKIGVLYVRRSYLKFCCNKARVHQYGGFDDPCIPSVAGGI